MSVDVNKRRHYLGLAEYFHRYKRNYAEVTVHLSCVLKKQLK